MSVDREEIRRKAMQAIDRATDEELARGRKDQNYAHDWLQAAIGWIANLITILGAVFRGGCLITTGVCVRRGLPDDSEPMTAFRSFRDTYLVDQDPSRLVEVQEYYSLALGVVRWANSSRNFRFGFPTVGSIHLTASGWTVEAQFFRPGCR